MSLNPTNWSPAELIATGVVSMVWLSVVGYLYLRTITSKQAVQLTLKILGSSIKIEVTPKIKSDENLNKSVSSGE